MASLQLDKQKRDREEENVDVDRRKRVLSVGGVYQVPSTASSFQQDHTYGLVPALSGESSTAAEHPLGRYPSPSAIADPYPLTHSVNDAVIGASRDATVDPAAKGLEDAYRYPSRTPSDREGYLYVDANGDVQYASSFGQSAIFGGAGQAPPAVFTVGNVHYCAAIECMHTAEAFVDLKALWEHQRCHRDVDRELAELAQPLQQQQAPAATHTPKRAAAPFATAFSPASASSPDDGSEVKAMQLAAQFPVREVISLALIVVYCCGVLGCKEAGTEHKTISNLRKHQRSHIPHEQLPHACDDCDQRFLYPARLRKHKDSQHDQVDYLCPVPGCGFSTNRFDNLIGKERHWEKKHPGLPKPSKQATERRAGVQTPATAPMATATPTSGWVPAAPPVRPYTQSSSSGQRQPQAHVPAPSRAQPHTPSRTPASPAQSPSHAQPFDVSPIDPALRHFQRSEDFQQQYPPLPGSSSRPARRSTATPSTPANRSLVPPSLRTSSSSSATSRSWAPSDGFSRSSAPSTAQTSISRASRPSRTYSQVAEEASKKPAVQSTPTRQSKPSAHAHGAKSSSSRDSSSSGGHSSNSMSLPIRSKPFEGFGVRRR